MMYNLYMHSQVHKIDIYVSTINTFAMQIN